jgi:hypothetical protein
MGDAIVEPFFLLVVWQIAVEQQVGSFKKVRLRRKVGDIIATIAQDTLVAVDIGYFRIAGCSGEEAGVIGEVACLAIKFGDVDDRWAFNGLVDWEFNGGAVIDFQGC